MVQFVYKGDAGRQLSVSAALSATMTFRVTLIWGKCLFIIVLSRRVKLIGMMWGLFKFESGRRIFLLKCCKIFNSYVLRRPNR